jgi:radical SAM protein with 4Fe4S-binding SPASM domain
MSNKKLSPTICMLPVSSIAIHATGKIVRCHMSEHDMGDVKNGSIIKQWDNENFQKLRKAQREGVWTDGCRNCRIKEERQITSKRIHWQNIGLVEDRWNDIDWDNNLTNNKIIHLDIAFNNLCNFKCRMCSSAYSNAWIGDEEKLKTKGIAPGGAGSIEIRPSNTFNARKHTLNIEQLQEIVDNGKDLRRVEILGGEPFLVPQFMDFLSMLRKSGLDKQIELMITTNGSVITEDHLEALEGFKYVNINLSLDATGDLFVYMRSAGIIDWDGIVKKAKLIKDWCEKPRSGIYKLNINGTFQSLNALNIKDFIEWIFHFYEWDKSPPTPSSKNRHSFEHRVLAGPRSLHVQWLSLDTLHDSLEQVNYLLKQYPWISGVNGKQPISEARYLLDIKKLLSDLVANPVNTYSLHGHRQFVKYTVELDKIRNQSLKDVAPGIYKSFESYFIEYESGEKTFCKMPWHAITITANDNIKPCCQFRGSIGTASKDNIIDNFINNPKMQKLRDQFIYNEKPVECGSCWEREQLIGKSRRKWFDEKFSFSVPNDYYQKPLTKENLKFVQMDINLSNVCNLKCRMCGSWASNQWFEEDQLLSKMNTKWHREGNPKNQVIIQQEMENLTELTPHLNTLRRIDFKGGEPMLAKSNVPFLEHLIKNGFNKDIALVYTTNGTVVNPKILQLLEKFRYVKLMFSIEGTGELYKYIRGGKYTTEELESVISMYNELPNVEIGFNVTMQAYNLLNLHELYKLLQSWSVKYKNVDNSNAFETICNSPIYLSPTVMPEQLRLQAISNLANISDFQSLINSLNDNNDNLKHWTTFKQFTKALDRIRNEKVLDVIPELKDFWND